MGSLSVPVPEFTLRGWNTNQSIVQGIIDAAMALITGGDITIGGGGGSVTGGVVTGGTATAGVATGETIDVEAARADYQTDVLTQNSLLSLLEAMFTTEINQGGYGLDPQDEADIWNRARDREYVNAQLAMDEAKRLYGMSGFSLPSGALTRTLERATLVSLEKNSSVNRDLAIKKAELYWEGKKFTVAQSLALKTLIFQVQDAIAKYNTQVAIANAELVIKAAEVSSRYVNEVAITNAKLATEVSISNAKNATDVSIANAELTFKESDATVKYATQIAVAEAEANARLRAAAYSMINANASVADHFNRSQQQSEQVSQNYTAHESNSWSEQHIYHYNQNA